MDDNSDSTGTPTSQNNIYVDIGDNDDNVITMVSDSNDNDKKDEENDNRSINSYGNVNEENEVFLLFLQVLPDHHLGVQIHLEVLFQLRLVQK